MLPITNTAEFEAWSNNTYYTLNIFASVGGITGFTPTGLINLLEVQFQNVTVDDYRATLTSIEAELSGANMTPLAPQLPIFEFQLGFFTSDLTLLRQVISNDFSGLLAGISAARDVLDGLPGTDTVEVALGNAFSAVPDLPTEDADDLVGDNFDNQIDLLGGDDVYDGKGGHDTINGGDGLDILIGGDGRDVISGGADFDRMLGMLGNDTMRGDGGDDRIIGGAGRDLIYGGTGDDDLRGQSGQDRIYAGDGHDDVTGGSDADRIRGGSGDDTIKGDGGDDLIIGDPGDDLIMGGNGHDDLRGQNGADTIEGGNGSDAIDGGAGRDLLTGGAANDTIDGGAGHDTLTGGAGRDTFVFAMGGGRDRITDFTDDEDTIQIDLPGAAPADVRAWLGANTVVQGGNLVIDLGGATLTIDGLTDANLLVNDLDFI
ncbi:MAG: calcium-binding protein [Pseudomonadota bacterium]